MEAQLSLLVEEHLPLVNHIVHQVAVHYPSHVDRQELVHAGTLGLVEAAQRWNPDLGAPFRPFVSRRIRGAILDYVRAADWAPRSVRRLGRDLEEARQALTARLGSVPTEDELSAELGMDVNEVRAISQRVARSAVLTLDHCDEDAGEGSLGEALADPDAPDPPDVLEEAELHAYVLDAVELLPDRMRDVVVGHFLEGKADDELADQLGVTKSRISQMRTEALRRLKDAVAAQYDGVPQDPRTKGRACRRRANYAEAVSAASTWRDRLGPRESGPASLTPNVAAA